MLSGTQIGAYSLSEPQAGSDAAALRCAAKPTGDGYIINGSKSFIGVWSENSLDRSVVVAVYGQAA
jgi:alkylation response protein AidB-like acyl-CoA dehydrogenase